MRRLGFLVFAAAIGASAGCAGSLEQGAASMSRGDYDGAAGWYRRAIDENPNDVSAYINLGIAYNRARRFDYALPVLNRAAQLAPNSAWARYQLAFCLQNLGRPADALREYGATAGLDPGCVHCLYAMGGLYRELGDLPSALATLNGYLGAARGVPAEGPFVRSAFALRDAVARELEVAQARQRELWQLSQTPAPLPAPPQDAPTPTPEPPPPPNDASSPDFSASSDERRQQALLAIVEAFGGEAARRDGVDRGGGVGAVEQIGGLLVRTDGIRRGLALAFPQLTADARGFLEPVVVAIFEGDLSPRNLVKSEFRTFAIERLKDRFKDRAQLITVVDFLWDVKLKAASR